MAIEVNDPLISDSLGLDNSHKSTINTDVDGYITHWGTGAEQMFGHTADEAIGQHSEICHQRSREALEREIITPLLRDGKLDYFGKMKRKSGETFDAYIQISVIRAPDGTITELTGDILDVTDRKIAEDSLRRYEQIVSASPDMMSFVGPGYRYLAVNDAYVKTLGRPKEEIIGHQVMEFVGHEKFNSEVKPLFDACLAGQSGRSSEWFDYEGVGRRYMDFVFEPVRGEGGVVLGIAASVRDITDRYQAQLDLKKQNALLQRAEKSAQVGHFRRHLSGGKIHWSDELYRIFGLNPEAFVPTRESVFSLIHPDDLEHYAEVADAAAANSRGYNIDVRVVRSDGSIRVLRCDVETEFSDDGEPVASFGVIKDVTETRETEADIVRRESEIASFTRLSTTGIFHTDREGRATYMSDRWRENMGVDDGLGAANNWASQIHPEDREATTNLWAACVAKGLPYTGEFRVIKPGGNIVCIYSEATPDLDPDGQVIGYVGFNLDITERKKIETAVKESDARYRDLYDNAPFAYVSINPNDGSFIKCNKAFAQMLGYSLGQVLDMKIQDYVPETDDGLPRAKVLLEILNRNEIVENFELQVLHRNGQIVWVSVSITDRCDASGRIIERRVTVVDVTERKLAEEMLRESEEQLSTVTSLSPVALVRTDRDGLVTFVNEAFLRIYGREREEMLMDGWSDAVHPEDIAQVEENWRLSVEAGSKQTSEFRIVQPDGNVVWVLGQAVPVLDSSGDIAGHISTLTDITARKAASPQQSATA